MPNETYQKRIPNTTLSGHFALGGNAKRAVVGSLFGISEKAWVRGIPGEARINKTARKLTGCSLLRAR